MMRIYVTEKALESMALKTRWNKILSCRDVYDIYIDATDEEVAKFCDYDGNNYSPISQLIIDGNIHPNPAKEIIDEIKKKPYKVLDDPSAVYFLDVTAEEAANIQRQYGVICKNENDIDDTELSDWREIVSCKDDFDHDWKEFLDRIKKAPTNSIIISDRYLFSNDELASDKKSPGIDNVIDILDAILPESFNSEYHVIVLYSDSPKNGQTCKIPFHKLSRKIYDRISDLRKFTILVEVVSVSGDSYGYDWTHNRRIVTNYHVIRAEHSFKAFLGKKSICSQSLNWDSLFSKGIEDKNDIPYKSYKILLTNLIDINDYGEKNPESSMYKYCCGGICPKSKENKNKVVYSKIQNRLVNNIKLL